MNGNQIRQAFLDYYRAKGHAILPSSPIVPENDPTTLFTGSGMQPMVPYLLGEVHPQGDRLADSQKCFRGEDIEDIGDNRHTTFFEMLGNWSLGSYWKQEQLSWLFHFLTKTVGLNPQHLYISVFSGSKTAGIPRDDEAILIWQQLFKNIGIEAKVVELVTQEQAASQGMQAGRIFTYDAAKNWWSRAGEPQNMPIGEPGGPDSEIFYCFDQVKHNPSFGSHCHPNCDCGRFMEICNSVFMAYKKTAKNRYQPLKQKNIDFGGGLERIAAAAANNPDVFTTDLCYPLIEHIENQARVSYADKAVELRIIADHMRGTVMMLAENILPSNKQQGYFVRRLIRRAIIQSENLHLPPGTLASFAPIVSQMFTSAYPEVTQKQDTIQEIINQEESKFRQALAAGKRRIQKDVDKLQTIFDPFQAAEVAFDYFQSYGVPLEVTYHQLTQLNPDLAQIDINQLEKEFEHLRKQHAQSSRDASTGMFKGGLADHSDTVVKYHTTTHLLHQALRDVLGKDIKQTGSNITNKRLRFDFTHPTKLTPDQRKKVEAIINQAISQDLPVTKTIEPKEQALKSGALAFFKEKYADQVSVYTIGNDPKSDWYSKELCGGPHVTSTGKIGTVRIIKETAVGAGTRRIYIQLADSPT